MSKGRAVESERRRNNGSIAMGVVGYRYHILLVQEREIGLQRNPY